MRRALFLLPLFAFGASAFAAETSGEIALVSDYRWRGLSLSDGDPSLQAEATLAFDNGAWLWGNANSVGDALGGAEIALGAGLTRTFAGLEWTLGATRYLYPGEADIDYTEADLTAARTIGALTLSAGIEYAPPQDDVAAPDSYLWIGAEYAASERVTLHARVGQDDGAFAPAPFAFDYGLGVSAAVGPICLELSYVDAETATPAIVFGVSRAF